MPSLLEAATASPVRRPDCASAKCSLRLVTALAFHHLPRQENAPTSRFIRAKHFRDGEPECPHFINAKASALTIQAVRTISRHFHAASHLRLHTSSRRAVAVNVTGIQPAQCSRHIPRHQTPFTGGEASPATRGQPRPLKLIDAASHRYLIFFDFALSR